VFTPPRVFCFKLLLRFIEKDDSHGERDIA
jgi:hypothetical protein